MRFTDYSKLTNGLNFAPKFMGNDELPEAEQMIFNITPMDHELKREFSKLLKVKMVGKKKDEIESNAHEIQIKVWSKCVNHTVNVEIVDPNTKTVNENPTLQELYKRLPSELVEEVLEAIENHSVLSAGEKKS